MPAVKMSHLLVCLYHIMGKYISMLIEINVNEPCVYFQICDKLIRDCLFLFNWDAFSYVRIGTLYFSLNNWHLIKS